MPPPEAAPAATPPFDSVDVEVRVRLLMREAVEAMFPDKFFFIDAMPMDVEEQRPLPGVANGIEVVRTGKKTYLFAAPFLPSMVQGSTPAETLCRALEWIAYKVKHQGPPRLGDEADRWRNELCALGVSLMSDAVIASEWDTDKQPWFEPFVDEEKEKEQK